MLPLVELAPGAEENGFANMLASLLRQNLEDHPRKRRDFTRLVGRVALIVEDADVAVTLRFQAGRLRVYDGVVGIPDVTVRGSSDDLTTMSLTEIEPRSGLPDPRGESVKALVAATKTGRIKTYGALTSLPFLLRLTRVMSVHPS